MQQNCTAVCVAVQIHLFSSIVVFFKGEKKKATQADKKNWPIKISHMFLVLEMFLFNCPWGTESGIT